MEDRDSKEGARGDGFTIKVWNLTVREKSKGNAEDRQKENTQRCNSRQELEHCFLKSTAFFSQLLIVYHKIQDRH
jgi:hypothetical protein